MIRVPESHRIRLYDNIIWYDVWKGVSTQRLRDGYAIEYILDDLKNANINVNDLKNYLFIVVPNWEGHSASDIESIRKALDKLNFPQNQFGAIFSCYENVEDLPYTAICVPDRLIYIDRWYDTLVKQQINWKDLSMNFKFSCLLRRASESRCRLARQLLDKFNLDDMQMTLGTMPGQDINQFAKIIHPYKYPIIVDLEEVFDTHLRHTHQLFYQVPVQLVVESSSETDSGSWRNIFITEKTYKVFAWHQLPVFFSVPGHVQKVKNQGFDVFDDIIDHSYDFELNPSRRQIRVVEQIENLCTLDLVDLRSHLWTRLKDNATLVRKIHTEAHIRHKTETQRLKNELLQLF